MNATASNTLLWCLVSFLLGALPFAVWLGRLAGVDPRAVGDGNPGATNAWKAGGWQLGVPVLVLDFLKGALPVGLARYSWEWGATSLIAVAIAPVLGHAFSPFLRGRGGKGLATTFGVWSGLTLAEGPLVMGAAIVVALLGLHLRDGWSLTVGLLTLGVDLLWRHNCYPYFLIWILHSGWLLWAYRHELHPPLKRSVDDR